MPNISPHHRDAGFRRHARIVTAAADADPATTCWRCRRTLNHCGPNGDGLNANGSPCTWDAGHVIDGDNCSPILAECSHCNRSHGNDATGITDADKIAAASRWRG